VGLLREVDVSILKSEIVMIGGFFTLEGEEYEEGD
jgi:hypothetical protein